jgi:parallel beta-helix repeat protein
MLAQRTPLIAPRLLMMMVPFALLALRSEAQDSVVFYVARSGADSWSGRLAAPNAARSDGPFASFERARDAVKRSREAGLSPVVRIRQGVYRFERSLVLNAAASGTKEHPVVWSAFPSEDVRCTGGRAIGGFHAVHDPGTLKRMRSRCRGKVFVTDLAAQGVRDFGILPSRMNLYYRGNRMPVARYPDRGWLTIAEVPQSGGPVLNQGDRKVIKNGLPAGRHCGMFRYAGNEPSRWKSVSGIWMHGYWTWDWRDAYQKVERIDTAAQLVYPAEPHHSYGYQQGQRYCFLNVLEELDSPGEWMLDETRGLLYFWPPAAIRSGDVSVSLLREPMVLLDGASHVRFQGLTFEASRACAFKVLGGSGNMLAGCTVRNIDNDTSVIIDGGTGNGVRSCDVYDVGSTGIRIVGGDRKLLTPAGNYATNNHISRFGRIIHTFNGGVYLQGVGNVVSHNRIHDAPFSGIQYYGNDHLIECNELYDLAHESGDVGGVNTGGDYSEMGTVIRYNYIHDTHGHGEGGFRGIYLDLPGSNTTIEGNIIANVDIGVFFNSGRDNVVENNVFFNCHPSVNIYVWPHAFYFHPGGPWKIVEKLHDVRYDEPPYSTHYPRLATYLDSADLGMPYGHSVVNNISMGGTWLDLSEGLDFTRVRVEKNVVADTMLLVFTRKWYPEYDPYHIGYAAEFSRSDAGMAREMAKRGNILSDPGIVDPVRGDFRLRQDSPAWGAGFRRIPVETIGLVADEFRKSVRTQ